MPAEPALYEPIRPLRLERHTVKLRRSLRLPGPYDHTKISTQLHDGVLEIHVPKGKDVRLSAEFRVAPLCCSIVRRGSTVRVVAARL